MKKSATHFSKEEFARFDRKISEVTRENLEDNYAGSFPEGK